MTIVVSDENSAKPEPSVFLLLSAAVRTPKMGREEAIITQPHQETTHYLSQIEILDGRAKLAVVVGRVKDL